MIFYPFFGSARFNLSLKSIALLFCVTGVFLQARAASKWDPIDPAEWAQTKSAIDPEAGAEVIVDETVMDGQSAYSSLVTHHVRVRIYGERGVESYSKVEIPYLKGTEIRKIEARTVTADGTTSVLDPKDIYVREILRVGNVRARVKAFAPPGLVPNCIVEYRYVIDSNEGIYQAVMAFRRKIPARLVHYKVRMDGYLAASLACVSFACPTPQLKEDKQGYYNFEMRDLPAQKEEAFSLPEINVQPVVVLYLNTREPGTPQKYWKDRAIELDNYLKEEGGSSRAIRNTLATVVNATDDLETKLHKIYDYCCAKIINRDRESADLTSEQKKKFKDNTNASDTLKQGNGTSYDINLTFAALARAAGAEVRLAFCNDRNFMLYSPKLSAPFMLPHTAVAIRKGDSWRYFDPGSIYLPFGQLNWNNCDTTALLSNPKEAEFAEIEGPAADFSIRRRVGNFTLDTEGTLEGDVVTTYTGLHASEVRDEIDNLTAEERAKAVRDHLQTTLKLAEVTDVVYQNVADIESELKVSYHLRVPEYAERTGSRMFVQPAVFQKNLQPVFDSATRNGPVLFHYRNTEKDEITILPPAGYTLEAASSPGGLDMGRFGIYSIDIGVFKKSGKIKYERKFILKSIVVPTPGYAGLKAAFDQIHAQDNHVLTLKQMPAPEAAQKVGDNPPSSEKPAATPAAPGSVEAKPSI